MKKLLSAILFLIFLVGAYLFIKKWKTLPPMGVGTGKISQAGGGGTSSSSQATSANSKIRQISDNPRQWEGKQVSLSGRVRGNTKYASNRNMYKITDGKYYLVVVDDKTAPIEYANRYVSGVVKVVKPPMGEGYAYIVSVKGNPNINLKWTDVSSFFSDKYKDVKKGINDATA